MKVTIQKTENVQIEVQLPLFVKDTNRYYKIEEKKTTQISFWQDEINVRYFNWALEYPCAYEVITEEEFNTIREQAKQFI